LKEEMRTLVAGVLQSATKMGCWCYNRNLVLWIVVPQMASHELHLDISRAALGAGAAMDD
jgi:hypothetical protein